MFQRAKYIEDPKRIEKIKDENLVSSRKWDGANYFMKIDENGKPAFISRRESVKGGFPDRTEKVPHLAELRFPSFKGHVFNVELIHTGEKKGEMESHPMVSGILNSLTPRAKEQQQIYGPIRAVVFDQVTPHVSTFKEKIETFNKLEKEAGNTDIFFTPSFKIGKEQLNALAKKTALAGQEGIIITDLNKPEAENIRIKIKHFKTANLRVKSITQELDKNGNPKDSAGALIVEDANGREVANVGTGLSRELRQQIWKNPNAWKGKLIQVKYMDVARERLRMPVYNGEADGSPDKFKDL